MLIRSMTAEDMEQVVHLEQAIFPDAWSKQAIADVTRENGGIALVAEESPIGAPFAGTPCEVSTAPNESSRICGYFLGRVVLDEGEVYRIAVSPEYRKAGIGKAVLSAFEQKASEMGARYLYLEVREGNQPAIRLYERSGWFLTGRRKRYYRDPVEDALLYSKEMIFQELPGEGGKEGREEQNA